MQVALRRVTYANNADEPTSGLRCAMTNLTSGDNSTTTCVVCFTVSLINDNAPDLFLGGSSMADHDVSVLYTASRSSSALVASSSARVVDADQGGVVTSLFAEIAVPMGDEVLWLDECGQAAGTGSCGLR